MLMIDDCSIPTQSERFGKSAVAPSRCLINNVSGDKPAFLRCFPILEKLKRDTVTNTMSSLWDMSDFRRLDFTALLVVYQVAP